MAVNSGTGGNGKVRDVWDVQSKDRIHHRVFVVNLWDIEVNDTLSEGNSFNSGHMTTM